MPKSTAGMGTGTNLLNSGPPDLPMRESTPEEVEEFRARMAAKRVRTSPLTPRPGAAAPAPSPTTVARATRPARERAGVDPLHARAVTAWLAGDTIAQICEQIGRSRASVYRILRAAGIDVKARPDSDVPEPGPVALEKDAAPSPGDPAPNLGKAEATPDAAAAPVVVAPYNPGGLQRRNVDDTELAAIVAAYAAGASAPQIAAAHGRRPKTIRDALDRAGVTRRDDRAYRSGGSNTAADDPALVADVAARYTAGATQAQIAGELGVGIHAIAGLMQRNNLETRPDATGLDRTAKSRRQPRPTPPPIEVPAGQAVPPGPSPDPAPDPVADPTPAPRGGVGEGSATGPECSCWPPVIGDRHGHGCDLYDEPAPVPQAPTRRAGTVDPGAVAALAAELTAATRPGLGALDLYDVVDQINAALQVLLAATHRLNTLARDLPPLGGPR